MPIMAHVWETAATPPAPTPWMEPLVLALLSDKGMSATQIAEDAYDRCEAKAAGRPRTLFLRHFGEQRIGTADLHSRTYTDFLRFGADTAQWLEFMQEFWWAWKARGSMRPTRIVIENEKGYGWFRIPGVSTSAERAAAIQGARNAGLGLRLPRDIASVTEAQFAAFNSVAESPAVARAIAIHDSFMARRWAKMIGELVIGTYTSIIAEEPPPSSNYGDMRVGSEFVDFNGFPNPVGTVCAGSDSSPWLWTDPNGARFASVVGSKPKMFAAMKGKIEKIRAIRGRIVPWIGVPGYWGDGWPIEPGTAGATQWPGWRKYIHQVALHGVGEVLYLVGNSGETAAQRAYAEETFATAIVATPNPTHRHQKPDLSSPTSALRTGTAGYIETEFAYNANDWS